MIPVHTINLKLSSSVPNEDRTPCEVDLELAYSVDLGLEGYAVEYDAISWCEIRLLVFECVSSEWSLVLTGDCIR